MQLQDIAPMALGLAALVGGLSFLLIGWVALIFLDLGADAGDGVLNSRPVVLTTILAPPVLPILGWWALRARRYGWSLAFALLTLPISMMWLPMWLRVSG